MHPQYFESEQESNQDEQINRLDLIGPAVADQHALAWIGALGFDPTALVRATVDTALDALAGHLSSSPALSEPSLDLALAGASLEPGWLAATSDLVQSLDSLSSSSLLSRGISKSAASLARVVLRRQCFIDSSSLLEQALNSKLRPRLVSLLRDDWPLCRQLLDTLAPTAYHAFASLTTVATLNHESEAIVCALVEAWQVICTDLRGFEGQLQQWATTTVDEDNKTLQQLVLSDEHHATIAAIATTEGDPRVSVNVVAASRIIRLWFLLIASPTRQVQRAAAPLVGPSPTPELVLSSLDTVLFALYPLDPLSRRLHGAKIQDAATNKEFSVSDATGQLKQLLGMLSMSLNRPT